VSKHLEFAIVDYSLSLILSFVSLNFQMLVKYFYLVFPVTIKKKEKRKKGTTVFWFAVAFNFIFYSPSTNRSGNSLCQPPPESVPVPMASSRPQICHLVSSDLLRQIQPCTLHHNLCRIQPHQLQVQHRRLCSQCFPVASHGCFQVFL
jgi:hypothetical protein